MTHGDQAKAKTAKSSQASATKKSSNKTVGKAPQGSKTVKTGGKEAGQGGKASKAGKANPKKAGSEKSSPAAKAVAAKETGNGGKGSKARPAAAPADDATTGFTNSAVATAFKRAVKKYPNAFRKLTD